ncbi:MAG: AtpZ/AtpI family protein [Sphingomonas sp.]|nr:AtpZ/AtpI family protein [Sphingomonas sp.]
MSQWLTRESAFPKRAISERGLWPVRCPPARFLPSPAWLSVAAFLYQDVSALADDRRSDDLDRRIADAKAEIERPITPGEGAAESRGWAIGIEFVGTVLVSAAIGYFIDRAAGTAPWVMIGLLVLGFIAGVYRASKTSAQFDADGAIK